MYLFALFWLNSVSGVDGPTRTRTPLHTFSPLTAAKAQDLSDTLNLHLLHYCHLYFAQPTFPSVVLRPGQRYRQEPLHTFSVRPAQ